MSLRHLVAALALASSITAHADTLFDISGTLQSGNTFSGTINLSPNTGLFGSEAFDAIDVTTTSGIIINAIYGPSPAPGGKDYSFASGPNGSFQLNLGVGELLYGYQGSDLCTTNNFCGLEDISVPSSFTSAGVIDYVTSGSIRPQGTTAVTPEPSSIALLGTGLIGVAGVMRRRFVQA